MFMYVCVCVRVCVYVCVYVCVCVRVRVRVCMSPEEGPRRIIGFAVGRPE